MNEIKIQDVDFKLMPNDEEFYFVTDLAEGKRVHRGGHIKAHPNNFRTILLCDEQTPKHLRPSINNSDLVGFVTWMEDNAWTCVYSESLNKRAWVDASEHHILFHGSDYHYTKLIKEHGKSLEELTLLYTKNKK
jgi:hypothetical protein